MDLFKKCCMLGLVIPVLLASCKTSKTDFVEPAKDISGSWQVIKVVQNGIDLTPFADLSTFRVNFNADKSYTLTGKMPFIVPENGTWAFNDPQYPFALSFTPASGTAVTSKLSFPIVGNGYQLGISFINKCDVAFENNYQYTLKQVK